MTTLSYLGIHAEVKIAKMYNNNTFSTAFLEPLFEQLSAIFYNTTKINNESSRNIKLKISSQDKKIEPQYGNISKIEAQIALRYGFADVIICWKSKTGKIYSIDAENILENDIEFWFEQLDVEKIWHYWKPKFSLITFNENIIRSYKKDFDFVLSECFCKCADMQLSKIFEEETKIKIDIEVGLSAPNIFHNEVPNWSLYINGKTSSIKCMIYVNRHSTNLTICWQSKSGRIYLPSDNDIDNADIEFWFDGLQPELYYKQMYPKTGLPFKIKNLSYELEVNCIKKECNFYLTLNKNQPNMLSILQNDIGNFINSFNANSEKKNDKYGFVKTFSLSAKDEINLELSINLGTSDNKFLKDFFKMLSDTNCIKRVYVS